MKTKANLKGLHFLQSHIRKNNFQQTLASKAQHKHSECCRIPPRCVPTRFGNNLSPTNADAKKLGEIEHERRHESNNHGDLTEGIPLCGRKPSWLSKFYLYQANKNRPTKKTLRCAAERSFVKKLMDSSQITNKMEDEISRDDIFPDKFLHLDGTKI